MRTIIAAVVAIGVGAHANVLGVHGQSAPDDRAVVLQAFQGRVQAYVGLHQRLEGPLPPMTDEAESWSMLLAKRYLASAIRRARSTAQQGDIFHSAAATVLRELIAEGLAGRDPEAFLSEFYAPHPVTHATHPIVNEPYPKSITHEVPPAILERLPPLPEHVEYRIVGHDLLLWDVHADLVVDFLPDAFARSETSD